MLRRVEFIGSGYEVVRFVMVDTPTMAEAIEAAQKWYKETGQTFHYCEMEIPKEYAYNESFPSGASVDERIADAEMRSRQVGANTDVKVLGFVDDIGYTQFSVSNAWYEKQENKEDAADLFDRASFDEESGLRDLTGKYLEPEI